MTSKCPTIRGEGIALGLRRRTNGTKIESKQNCDTAICRTAQAVPPEDNDQITIRQAELALQVIAIIAFVTE